MEICRGQSGSTVTWTVDSERLTQDTDVLTFCEDLRSTTNLRQGKRTPMPRGSPETNKREKVEQRPAEGQVCATHFHSNRNNSITNHKKSPIIFHLQRCRTLSCVINSILMKLPCHHSACTLSVRQKSTGAEARCWADPNQMSPFRS